MGLIVSGHLTFAPQARSGAEAIVGYPDNDLERSRPAIRSSEAGLGPLSDTTWVQHFWKESWNEIACLEAVASSLPDVGDSILTRAKLNDIRDHLIAHWQDTLPSTAIESKHDAVFGMTLFCLRILDEMLGIGIGTGVLGRLGLRTILETRINLTYLVQQDQMELWDKWRAHGAGQAKLSVLKYEDEIEAPSYIDLNAMKAVAFEDKGPEFMSISLAQWSGLDLRKISEQTGLKELYDQHFPANSGFVHGTWGGVREAIFQTCANPLHRLHRIPQSSVFKDTVESAAALIDDILQHVDDTYPTFAWRLLPAPSSEVTQPAARS